MALFLCPLPGIPQATPIAPVAALQEAGAGADTARRSAGEVVADPVGGDSVEAQEAGAGRGVVEELDYRGPAQEQAADRRRTVYPSSVARMATETKSVRWRAAGRLCRPISRLTTLIVQHSLPMAC